MAYPYAINPRDKKLTKAVCVPDIKTNIWPVLFGSRYPATDPRCMKCGVFLTNIESQYQTVSFALNANAGNYVKTVMQVEKLGADRGIPMNWVSLSLNNNINVNTGFCIPDKLPDETGKLTELKAGEKMYTYILFKMQHCIGIDNGILEQACTTDKLNFDGVTPIGHGNTTSWTSDWRAKFAPEAYGLVVAVCSAMDRVMFADGASYDKGTTSTSTGEKTPNKYVNYLVSTVTNQQISKMGQIDA